MLNQIKLTVDDYENEKTVWFYAGVMLNVDGLGADCSDGMKIEKVSSC